MTEDMFTDEEFESLKRYKATITYRDVPLTPVDSVIADAVQPISLADREIYHLWDLPLPTRSIFGIHQEWPGGSEMDRAFAYATCNSLSSTRIILNVSVFSERGDWSITGRCIDILMQQFGIKRQMIAETNVVNVVSSEEKWAFSIVREGN